jgi:hypothetical protein
MINPINPNKFISFKDQQSMGQLNDPLQTEQNFLANRMSQPVPVPEVQSPMMQQKKGKMQTVQNDPKLQKGSDASYGISGYVNTEKEYKQALQEKNHPNVYSSPAKQTDYPHADTNKGRPYVVNQRPGVWQPGTEDRSKDTLFLPNNFRGQKGKMIDEDDYIDNAKINKEEYFQVGVQDLEDQGRIKIRK